MVAGLLAQSQAAQDPTFVAKVRDAIVTAATLIYTEATALNAHIKSGTANAAVTVNPALGVAIPPGTVIRVGNELLVSTAGAAQGAVTIATTTTTTQDHIKGEPVSPPSVPNHAARASYARQVLNNPDQYVAAFAAALASLAYDVNATDAAISGGVSAVWDDLAGA